jgi:hypothetical protein
MSEVKAIAMPASIGEAIDLLYQMRATRLERQKQIDEAQAQETALKQHIIANFDVINLEGAKGHIATASIKRSTQANVTDWVAFREYIVENGAWDLVQKRTSITGLKDRWDNKEVIPGVESFTVIDLSLTKVSN